MANEHYDPIVGFGIAGGWAVKGLMILAVACGPVFGQGEAPSAPAAAQDEIVIVGRTPRELRAEIERVENAVFERFNAINSTDEYDIKCDEYAPLGTRIETRYCAPHFAVEAYAAAARDTIAGLQGSPYSSNSQAHHTEIAHKRRLLEQELVRLAAEDEQLGASVKRLIELHTLANPPRERGRDRERRR